MNPTPIDKINQQRIAKLHPIIREEVIKIIQECDQALTGKAKIRITQGLRTFQEQDQLYALGRTQPNPNGKSTKRPLGYKVTNAKAGQSIHNYGFAVDICMIINGKEASWDHKKDWDNDKTADWYECVKIFAKYGWDWGGNWKTFKDIPHFDKKGYNSWRTLAKLPRDKDNYCIIPKPRK